MGTSQSKPVPRDDEKVQVLSRDMDSMSISQEKQWVVDNDVNEGPAYTPSGLSVSLAKRWEEALVKDPKVRVFILFIFVYNIPKTMFIEPPCYFCSLNERCHIGSHEPVSGTGRHADPQC